MERDLKDKHIKQAHVRSQKGEQMHGTNSKIVRALTSSLSETNQATPGDHNRNNYILVRNGKANDTGAFLLRTDALPKNNLIVEDSNNGKVGQIIIQQSEIKKGVFVQSLKRLSSPIFLLNGGEAGNGHIIIQTAPAKEVRNSSEVEDVGNDNILVQTVDGIQEVETPVARGYATPIGSAWTQASFPVNKGGLGIRRTEELALPAYLASVHSVAGLDTSIIPEFVVENEVSSAIREWCGLTGLPSPSTSVQKLWDSPLVNKSWDRIISSASVRDKARLQAVSLKESGSWLNAFPIPSLGDFLDDNCLRISVALRLDAALCCSYKCICGTGVDVYGHHGLSCNKSSGRYMRHSAINDVIKRALISGNVQSILEPPELCRDDGERPDGMSLIPWKRGKALILDVTCVDFLADSNIVSSIKAAGTPEYEAEKIKCGKYKCLKDKFIFIPLGFETFGPWGPSAKEMISTIGHLIYA
ncbi:unnamed protein product [Phaedon cochleariae]|uniref:Uncharacterized protein n=1 Tax=Phaedon cochleariae TaxID=80249 RepID=A0A9N9SC47_PHACE|nr:unnamed protein product [Phaedon cochleariae]